MSTDKRKSPCHLVCSTKHFRARHAMLADDIGQVRLPLSFDLADIGLTFGRSCTPYVQVTERLTMLPSYNLANWLIHLLLFSGHDLHLPHSRPIEVFYLVGQLLNNNVGVLTIYVAHVLIDSLSSHINRLKSFKNPTC